MSGLETHLSHPRIISVAGFIKRNHLELRGYDEIVERFKAISGADDDFFGFKTALMAHYLRFEDAKSILKDEYVREVESGDKKWVTITDTSECAQDFLDYMSFAWGKAEGERGISASRSIEKLGTWLWLMGRGDLEELISQDDLYNPYGAPALIEVCERMGIVVPDSLIEFSKVKC